MFPNSYASRYLLLMIPFLMGFSSYPTGNLQDDWTPTPVVRNHYILVNEVPDAGSEGDYVRDTVLLGAVGAIEEFVIQAANKSTLRSGDITLKIRYSLTEGGSASGRARTILFTLRDGGGSPLVEEEISTVTSSPETAVYSLPGYILTQEDLANGFSLESQITVCSGVDISAATCQATIYAIELTFTNTKHVTYIW